MIQMIQSRRLLWVGCPLFLLFLSLLPFLSRLRIFLRIGWSAGCAHSIFRHLSRRATWHMVQLWFLSEHRMVFLGCYPLLLYSARIPCVFISVFIMVYDRIWWWSILAIPESPGIFRAPMGSHGFRLHGHQPNGFDGLEHGHIGAKNMGQLGIFGSLGAIWICLVIPFGNISSVYPGIWFWLYHMVTLRNTV